MNFSACRGFLVCLSMPFVDCCSCHQMLLVAIVITVIVAAAIVAVATCRCGHISGLLIKHLPSRRWQRFSKKKKNQKI